MIRVKRGTKIWMGIAMGAGVLTLAASGPEMALAAEQNKEIACAPVIQTREGMEIPTAVWGSGVERVKAATKVYGKIAMQMQRTYGVPWEVLIAQMQVESQIGQTGAARNGSNNWLGINGKGDAGRSGRYARFSSVEASIQAWAQKVIRNGLYDEAMWHTDPNKWNLRDFLANMVHVYAPASDGNDEAGYVRDVLSIINNMVRPAREEMGWPSSEELAKSENIAVGGIYPIGSEVGSELVQECTAESGMGSSSTGNEIHLLKNTSKSKNKSSSKSSSKSSNSSKVKSSAASKKSSYKR